MAIYNTIQKIAKEGPCVFIGRCSNYVLRDFDNVMDCFIYAPLDKRIETVMERFGLSEKKAREQIIKEDKARASYYNYYSSYKWGQAEIKYQTGQNTVCYAQDCLRKRHAC